MQLPFDQSKLDKLLDDHGIDFLIINDKNTAQYLLGGYKFFFFAQKTQLVSVVICQLLDIQKVDLKWHSTLDTC